MYVEITKEDHMFSGIIHYTIDPKYYDFITNKIIISEVKRMYTEVHDQIKCFDITKNYETFIKSYYINTYRHRILDSAGIKHMVLYTLI